MAVPPRKNDYLFLIRYKIHGSTITMRQRGEPGTNLLTRNKWSEKHLLHLQLANRAAEEVSLHDRRSCEALIQETCA